MTALRENLRMGGFFLGLLIMLLSFYGTPTYTNLDGLAVGLKSFAILFLGFFGGLGIAMFSLNYWDEKVSISE